MNLTKLKERIKHAKESKELGLDSDHSIIIKMGKKSTTVKILKWKKPPKLSFRGF